MIRLNANTSALEARLVAQLRELLFELDAAECAQPLTSPASRRDRALRGGDAHMQRPTSTALSSLRMAWRKDDVLAEKTEASKSPKSSGRPQRILSGCAKSLLSNPTIERNQDIFATGVGNGRDLYLHCQ